MVTYIDVSRTARNDDIDDISDLLSTDSIVEVEIPMRGLLVKESVVVSHCSRNFLEAQSSNISHFCTGTFNYPLFIKIRGTNKIIVGRLADLLVYNGRIRLNDFKIFNQDWTERKSERVQPKQPTFITLWNNKRQIRANLFDLSKTGAGVFIERTETQDFEDLLGADVHLMLKVPPKNTLCKIPGKVTQSRQISNELIRLGVQTFPAKSDDKVLDRYLTERKREILDEVYYNFKEMLNFRETKDEYF